MSEFHTKQALQTRERAFEDAWIVYQRNVIGLSVAAICVLAAAEPIKLGDGSLSPQGGIGRPLAQSTVYGRLADARDQFRDEYMRRPILDAIMEEDDRLEHLAAMHMQDARAAKVGTVTRGNALDRYLRTLESRRKLLGIDRPQQVEITHTVEHDDPATTKLRAAMVAAKAKMDADLAEAQEVEDDA